MIDSILVLIREPTVAWLVDLFANTV